MRGLIVCAGKGSRLHPFSVSVPKPLLPVANKPVLYYGIEKIAELGIEHIALVINPLHEKKIVEQLGFGERWGVEFTFIYQHEPKGIADAVLHAKDYMGAEPFILFLGDNLLQPSLLPLKESVELNKNGAALLLSTVENPQDFGVAVVKGGKVIELEEKPRYPKSNLAIMGAYAFTCTIFEAIENIAPSARGEYEITDAIEWLIHKGHNVSYVTADEQVTDVGTFDRWLEANRWMLDELGTALPAEQTYEHVQLIPPVAIGPGCVIKNSRIGPYVTVGKGSTIVGCSLSDTIVLDGTYLQNLPYEIRHSIVGYNSIFIHENVKVRGQ